jgi:hypothetical protein
MQGSITLNQLGIVIIFLLLATAAVYAIVALKNFNDFLKKMNMLLQSNTEYFNTIIPNINAAAENTVTISREVKESLNEAGNAIKTISHETTDTMLTINQTADHLAKYVILIGEVFKTVFNAFSSSKKI